MPKQLRVRIREAKPGETLPGIQSHQICEVLDGDQVLGELPIKTASFEMKANAMSIVHLTIHSGGVHMESLCV